MESTEKYVVVKGEQRQLPEGIEHVREDLYSVDFALLNLAKQDDSNGSYRWYNPRKLGETKDRKGLGFDPDSMNRLLTAIRDDGLAVPLMARWEIVDNILVVQVLDGERRYRCIDRLRDNDDGVFCREKQAFSKASEVYSKILCRIVDSDDIEALKIAFSMTDNAVGWEEGATLKLVQRLRSSGCDDDAILKITRRKENWLRETDRLCALDEITLNYFVEGKINRALALRLSNIQNADKRVEWLESAYEQAIEEYEEEKEKVKESVEKSIDKQELVEAQIDEASTDEESSELQETLAEIKKKTAEKKEKLKGMKGGPQAKNRNLNRVVKSKNAQDSGLEKILTPKKIEQHSVSIQQLIDNGGNDPDGDFVCAIESLKACKICYNAILKGEEDIVAVLGNIDYDEQLSDEPEALTE